ncbi:MAG TPA: NAD-dependent epimerase/dehydratase family protein [Jatrophihabitantaceae bacterium]|jgi:nucleoside-diphosphate-sugar epimerase|nr:NAD-dependent epimerase/dehydratase family protein [Jatrophihabitantaceae bacterium]
MRVLVVGATGHVGSYLVPSLVRSGHDVVAMSRGEQEPYRTDDAWARVERRQVDRAAADAAGKFVDTVLATAPDVVIDMVCFEPSSARALVAGLAGRIERLLMCGTIWVHGPTMAAPTRESDPRSPCGDYGVQKAEIEQLVLAASGRLPAVVLHPGHISGPGWPVINPVGNLDASVWRKLATGEPLLVPGDGVGMLHHVHAEDVAQAFLLAVTSEAAVGESFHVVSEQAVSTRGLASAAAGWFGQEAVLRPVPWNEFDESTTPEHAAASREHLQRSHVMSIEKARNVLGYEPRHSSFDAVHEAVDWLTAHDQLPGVPAPR